MLVIQNKKLKLELKELIKPFTDDINNFKRHRIIYEFLERLNKEKKLKKVIKELKTETKIKQKSVLTKDGFFYCLKTKKLNEIDLKISANLWLCYSSLATIHKALKKYKKVEDKKEKLKLEKYLDDVMSNYQNKQIFELSLWAISNHIFDLLDKEIFLSCEKIDKNILRFDEVKSLLFILDYKIKISERDKITNAHKVLKYIFIDNANNLNDDFHYSEIAENEFENLEHKKEQRSWQRYYDTCLDIQNKISKHTKNNVDNFLIFNTGSSGRVKINSKYLPFK